MMAMDNEILKTYEIVGKIGEGSGGTIYKAYHKRLEKMVVLKKLTNPKQSMQANKREVNILKQLNNTYLPQVIDFLNTDAGVFTVMSYVPGKSFQQLKKEGAAFSKEDLLKWALQMCNALNYLHTQTQPIIHGDIKPSNIMLTPEGNVCIIDFNISMFVEEQTVLGCTKGYTSPEQFQAVVNKKNRVPASYVLDERTDIYSTGATLYYLATGRMRDYEEDPDMDLLSSKVGRDFAEVIRMSMEIDPHRRYRSTYDMYNALRAVPERGKKSIRDDRVTGAKVGLIAVAAVLVLASVAGGIFAFKQHQMNAYAQLIGQQGDDIKAGDFDGELECYTKAVDMKPHEPDAYYWHAYADYACGDYATCVSKIDNSLGELKEKSSEKSHKRFAEMYALKGSAYLADGEDERAVDAFEEANTHYPEMEPNEYRQYATALARVGRYEDAWDALNEADKADGGNSSPQSDNTRGEIRRAEGDLDGAAKYFDKCIAALKDKKNRSYFEENLLCNTYVAEADMLQEKNLKKSKELMKDAEKHLLLGGQIIANRKLGAWDYNTKNYDESIACYKKIVSAGKATKDDYEALGECYAAVGDSTNVRKIAEERKNESLSGKEDFYYYRLLALAEAIDISDRKTDDGSLFYRYYYEAQKREDSHNQSAMTDLDGVYETVQSNNY